MAVTNSTVCMEERSNCDTITTMSIRSFVTTGFSKNNNVTFISNNVYSVNKTDGTNKFRRAKRSEHKLNHDEFDYDLKPSTLSEPNDSPNEINKPEYSDYNNVIYGYNSETKHNADVRKYNINEPEYLVKGKYLNMLAQNDNSLYFSQPTYKSKTDLIINNQQKFATKDINEEFESIANKNDQQQKDSINNLNKHIYINQPKQKHELQSKLKLNVLQHANNNTNYDRLEFSKETKLMDETQHYIANDYTYTLLNKTQRVENIDQALVDSIVMLANRARDVNKPLSTNTPENVNIKESSVKKKHKREKEEKYLLNEYGPINTLMIDTSRNLSFDDNLFKYKLGKSGKLGTNMSVTTDRHIKQYLREG